MRLSCIAFWGYRPAACLRGYWTTRGYTNSWIANSWTGRLADWSTCGLDNSHTGQVADWTTRGCHRQLCMLSFRSFGGICETASCPVHDLSTPRVDNTWVGVSASCLVTVLVVTRCVVHGQCDVRLAHAYLPSHRATVSLPFWPVWNCMAVDIYEWFAAYCPVWVLGL